MPKPKTDINLALAKPLRLVAVGVQGLFRREVEIPWRD